VFVVWGTGVKTHFSVIFLFDFFVIFLDLANRSNYYGVEIDLFWMFLFDFVDRLIFTVYQQSTSRKHKYLKKIQVAF